MIKFKFKGAKVFENKVNRSINDLGDKFQKIIMDEFDKIDNISKLRVPIGKTHRLKNSRKRSGGIIDTTKIKVDLSYGKGIVYAPFQDFGTGSQFSESKYNGYTDYIVQWKGGEANPEVSGKAFLFYPFMLGTRAMDRKTKTFVKNLL